MVIFERLIKGVKNPFLAIRHLRETYLLETEQVFLDESTLRYVLWLDRLYRRIDEIPGHIVELGVGPGTNAIIFGHLINLYGDGDIRKYYAFDTFGGYTPEDLDSSPHLPADSWKNLDRSTVNRTLRNHGADDVTTLIEGDIKSVLPGWLESADTPRRSPNSFHVALLYVDCNAYAAASHGLEALVDYLSPGAVVAVDELKQGGETRALREFCEDQGTDFKKDTSPISHAPYTIMPTAGG